MNKSDLVNAIAAGAELSKADAKKALDATLNAIADALKEGDKVALLGFGTFAVTERPARTGINPATKEKIEIAAKKVEEKLSTYYQKAGFSSSNTYFKFNEDGTFNAKIDGKSWSGTYTFDEKTHAIDLKGRLLLSLNGFATKNTSGISILFESKKLLTIIQTLTALSGNTTLGTIGEISKNYDGIRVGFDLSK